MCVLLICATYLYSLLAFYNNVPDLLLTKSFILSKLYLGNFNSGNLLPMKKISVLRKSKAYKIYNELCSRLDNNIYSKHLPMPAASAIAAEFGVSVGTANQALRLLADENRVIRKIGSGTYPAKFIKQPRIACLLQDMTALLLEQQ